MARDYLIMEKMIEGTNGSPGGWIASMHSPASGLLADIMTSKVPWPDRDAYLVLARK